MIKDKQLVVDLESRWPGLGDSFFVKNGGTGVANVVSDPLERFYRMPIGYKRAGDVLICHALANRVDRDNVVYGVLFCYRQAIELFLKRNIDTFRNGKVYTPEYTHELRLLWERFVCITDERGLSESIGMNAVQSLVEEMDDVDRKADGFRFSTDRDQMPFTSATGTIDLVNLREVMQGLTNFFENAHLALMQQSEISSHAE